MNLEQRIIEKYGDPRGIPVEALPAPSRYGNCAVCCLPGAKWRLTRFLCTWCLFGGERP